MKIEDVLKEVRVLFAELVVVVGVLVNESNALVVVRTLDEITVVVVVSMHRRLKSPVPNAVVSGNAVQLSKQDP